MSLGLKAKHPRVRQYSDRPCAVNGWEPEVVPGIGYSIEGMRRGGKRKVKISPHLGYREAGIENLIPPNAVLVYEIEVLEVKQGS